MEFEGKVALITGAAHGFGEAIATQAAAQKMKLALLDQDQEALGQVVKKLKQSTDVLEIVADVTEEEQVYAAVDKTMTAYGQIDLLVNDAGVAVPGPIWELPTRDWEWILHADLMSQVYALRKVIPIMMKQENGGDILNVASAAGLLTARECLLTMQPNLR
nr:SDR family NAD(P)-dependent oxidoreductase [Ligilactobacillus equi]